MCVCGGGGVGVGGYIPALVDQLDEGQTSVLLDGVLPLLRTQTETQARHTNLKHPETQPHTH